MVTQDQKSVSDDNGEGGVHDEVKGQNTIPGVFARAVIQHGKRRAIGASKWQPDFVGLEVFANRIANGILARGGVAGDRVAVMMAHDAPLLAVVLGVLKAGRVAVVMSAGTPVARMREMVADAAPALLVTDTAHEALAEEVDGVGGVVVSHEALSAVGEARDPDVLVAPEAPAFLIYTSGSTGRPKGVVQTHRNILHTVAGYTRAFGIRAGDRFCLLGSLGGGQGVMTAFCALLNGAAVYPYSLRQRGLGELSGWMVRHKISVFIAAASIFRQFVRAMPAGVTFPSLRLVRLGAERARPADLEACRRIAPDTCRFAHVLSSSETGNLTIFQCGVRDVFEGDELPVGYPNEGKTILIRDEEGKEVGVGEAGEIVVRSRYLSPGYWRDAEATRAVFEEVPDSEERLYRTGDLGRWREDGQLEHLGRLDRRSKVLGNGLEMGEVEAALEAEPGVLDSVVMMRSKTRDQEADMLEAWVVLREGAVWEEGGMRERLGKKLPSYAVPARIVRVSRILRTANGKVDAAAMASCLGDEVEGGVDEARTPMERRVAAVWREALKRPTVGIYENFFEGAGDSLQAVDLILSLSEALKCRFDASALVNHPSIAQFAEAVETGRMCGEREPWFRLPRASLLDLRRGGEGRPVLCLPGGYTGENELMVFAKLGTLLNARHPMCGVRLNLHAKRVWQAFSLGSLARQAGRAYLRRHGTRVPVIVGECRATTLACLTAEWLGRKLGKVPPIVLLDPWHPRFKPSSEGVHPPGIEKYYRLLSETPLVRHGGEAHVVCTAESGRGEICREWWSERLGGRCELRLVPGDHTSYLREHRKDLAAVLNGIFEGLS